MNWMLTLVASAVIPAIASLPAPAEVAYNSTTLSDPTDEQGLVAVARSLYTSIAPLQCQIDQERTTTSKVVTLQTTTSKIKHLEDARLRQRGDDEIHLDSGEVLLQVNAPTVIRSGDFLIDAQAGSTLYLASLDNVFVVRNMGGVRNHPVLVTDKEGRRVLLSEGQELLAGLDEQALDGLLARSSRLRQLNTKLELMGRPQTVISRIASVSSFRTSSLLESLKISNQSDDRTLSRAVAKLEARIRQFDDNPSLFLCRE